VDDVQKIQEFQKGFGRHHGVKTIQAQGTVGVHGRSQKIGESHGIAAVEAVDHRLREVVDGVWEASLGAVDHRVSKKAIFEEFVNLADVRGCF